MNSNWSSEAIITNRLQNGKERVSDIQYRIEEMNTPVTDNVNSLKIWMQNIQKIKNTMRRPNVGITEIKESKENQVKKKSQKIFFL